MNMPMLLVTIIINHQITEKYHIAEQYKIDINIHELCDFYDFKAGSVVVYVLQDKTLACSLLEKDRIKSTVIIRSNADFSFVRVFQSDDSIFLTYRNSIYKLIVDDKKLICESIYKWKNIDEYNLNVKSECIINGGNKLQILFHNENSVFLYSKQKDIFEEIIQIKNYIYFYSYFSDAGRPTILVKRKASNFYNYYSYDNLVPFLSTEAEVSSVSLHGTKLYLGTQDGMLYVFDSQKLTLIDKQKLTNYAIINIFVYSDNQLSVVTTDPKNHNFKLFDRKSQNISVLFRSNDKFRLVCSLLNGNKLFAIDSKGHVTVLHH